MMTNQTRYKSYLARPITTPQVSHHLHSAADLHSAGGIVAVGMTHRVS